MNSAHEWRILTDALQSLKHPGSPQAALATIVRTRGSTFRRAGTRMLVFEDGRIVCELSGGCPQRDIVWRAQQAMADGQPRMASYNAESGLDLLLEMGCGGELDVLIEPLTTPHSVAFAEALAQHLSQRQQAWLATLFAVDSRVVEPQHLVWCGQETTHDGLDDAALSRSIIGQTQAHGLQRLGTLHVPHAEGMADVLVEAVIPAHALIVIGSDTAALAMAPLAALLGWQVTLVDQDPQRLQARSWPPGVRTLCASPSTIGDVTCIDAHTSVIVMTHNIEQDIAYLSALRDTPLAYIGALGSRERAERMRDDARFAQVRHLYAPAGLDIGSDTPTEIALSVFAEILAVLNQRGGGFLRDQRGTLHG